MATANPPVDRQAGVLRVPLIGATKEEILDFRRKYFNFMGTYRNRHMERMALNVYYTIGRQWIELDTQIITDGVRGYAFKDYRNKPNYEFPRPVTNYIAPAVEVEIAALTKQQLTPNVVTMSRDPRMEAAAKIAKDILQARMKSLDWDGLRELSTWLTVVTGTGILKSYWDAPYSDPTLVASPAAVSCPSCGSLLADRKVPRSVGGLGLNLQGAVEVPIPDNPPEEYEPEMELQNCPHCPEGVPLQPAQMAPDDAQGQDFLGRDLGINTPKGNTCVEVVSPFDIFPQNGGLDVTPENAKLWGQATVRDLDWIEDRYPDMVDKVIPDDPVTLMRYHPVLGEWSLLGRYHSVLDSGIYQNHALVFEVAADPNHRFPDGRYICMTSREILDEGPLYDKVGGARVSKVRYSGARFKVRHKEFWGQGLVDDLTSPQNRINGMDAQIIEARERMGSPNLLVANDMMLDGPEWFEEYGAGKVMHYEASALNPQGKPEVFGSILMPDGVYEERNACIQDMKQIAGPQDVEIGEAPRNISTTSGLQILGESAERRRASRQRSLNSMYQKIWEHQLRLLAIYRVEPDEYEIRTEDGSWETKQFNRNVLQGQHKITIEKQAYIDKSLYQKEGTREAQADGLYDISTQLAKKRILELRGLPTDVNEDLNRQVDLGKKQWIDFVDNGIIPNIDTTLDAFRIRFQAIGTLLLSSEGKELEAKVGWPELSKALAGWQDQLKQAEMLDAQVLQFYGGRLPQQQAQEAYAKAMIGYAQQKKTYEQQTVPAEQAAAGTGMPVAPAPPPQEPPPPIFLPAAKEDRVYMTFIKTLQLNNPQPPGQNGQQQSPIPQGSPLESFLKFRAVLEAYKLLAEEQEAKEMMPGAPPGAPPPGTPEGNPGMGGANPGLDFSKGPNPPNPSNPPIAPGVGGNNPIRM